MHCFFRELKNSFLLQFIIFSLKIFHILIKNTEKFIQNNKTSSVVLQWIYRIKKYDSSLPLEIQETLKKL